MHFEALFTVAQMPLSNEVHAGGDSQASLALEQTGDVTLNVDGWTKKAVDGTSSRRRKRAMRQREGRGAIFVRGKEAASRWVWRRKGER